MHAWGLAGLAPARCILPCLPLLPVHTAHRTLRSLAAPTYNHPQAFGSYSGTFWAAAALYVSSWAVFVGVLRGDPVRLAPAGGGGGDSNGP